MTIGIDASHANKPQKTGTEWYSYYLIKNLADIDHENQYRLYVPSQPAADLSDGLPANFKFQTLHWPLRKLWTQIRLSRHLLKTNPDVLFVPAHTLPIAHPANTITTCHDIGFDRLPWLYPPSERLYQKFSLRLAIKQARKVITVSQFTKRELIAIHNIPEEKIEVVYHGYNDQVFKATGTEFNIQVAKEFDLEPDNFLIYVGRLEAKKNTLGLIKAFQLLINSQSALRYLQLALVGNPGFRFTEIAKYLHSQKLENQVRILGYVPLPKLPSLICASAAFVFPTMYEGFGLPVLEAMACGKLVLASRIPPIQEIAGDGAIYFDQNSPEDMAKVIAETLSDRAKLAVGLQPIWAARLALFSWQKCARETLSILTSH